MKAWESPVKSEIGCIRLVKPCTLAAPLLRAKSRAESGSHTVIKRLDTNAWS